MPKVSICLPTLNTLSFLRERCMSIFHQSFRDWELLVYDSYSDDGSWEYLTSLASTEPRMRLLQGPREGPYPAWNRCVSETTGEYIYIATSDDTMASDCLEKLVVALDRHSTCDLAHCPLKIIDSTGELCRSAKWPEATTFAEGLPEDIAERTHVRVAPYDGLLHLTGRHVILSITQLLIRRTLFDKIGMFPSRWGNISDFNWEMKAGLLASMVHVTGTWASWRIHSNQLTATTNFQSPERDQHIESMIQDAMESCYVHLPSCVQGDRWLSETASLRQYYSYLAHGRPVTLRRLHQATRAIIGPNVVRLELLRQFLGRSRWPEYAPVRIRHRLESVGLSPISFH